MSAVEHDCRIPEFSDTLMRRIRDVKRTSLTIVSVSKDVLVANLTFLHDAVVASEQLLIDAAQKTELLPSSSFHDCLARYYRSHLEEERDHVAWLRDDLKSAGIDLGAPDQLAMSMVGTQYYLLKHVHPAALLGYLAVVEGDPTPTDAVEILEQAYGKNLLRFVRFHAVKDLEHRKELFEVTNLAPAHLHSAITQSAENVLQHLIQAVTNWRSIKCCSADGKAPGPWPSAL